ncbi:MAG: hypothetical protein IT427_13175 [Pirellulales bacterium]|nr:hypothetical protein [Pirellulales bacterium]
MKRKLIVSLVAVVSIVSNSTVRAACHGVRVRHVQHHHATTTKVVVPFAVPVAVPVAVASPYFYGYSQFAVDPSTAVIDPRAHDAAVSSASRAQSPIAQHCATCHSSVSPAGELSLQHVEKLSLADRLAAIRAVLSRRMPKGAKLDDDQLRGVVEELANYD